MSRRPKGSCADRSESVSPGAAVWGLTLERLIARRFGLPEPQEVSDCPSFRMVEGEKGEAEISYFMYFIKETDDGVIVRSGL